MKKDLVDKSSIISKILYWVLSSNLIHYQCLFFSISFSPTFVYVKRKSYCWNRCCLLPPITHPEIFCNKPRTLLSSFYVHLILCVKPLSKHLKANFKHLLGIELATDVIFLVLSPVTNDLFIYVFATGGGYEITYVGNTELKNVPYISAKVTCTINFIEKETLMLRVKIWTLSFLGGSKYLT